MNDMWGMPGRDALGHAMHNPVPPPPPPPWSLSRQPRLVPTLLPYSRTIFPAGHLHKSLDSSAPFLSLGPLDSAGSFLPSCLSSHPFGLCHVPSPFLAFLPPRFEVYPSCLWPLAFFTASQPSPPLPCRMVLLLPAIHTSPVTKGQHPNQGEGERSQASQPPECQAE